MTLFSVIKYTGANAVRPGPGVWCYAFLDSNPPDVAHEIGSTEHLADHRFLLLR